MPGSIEARATSSLLEEGREELERGDLRRAAEEVWGAVALAVKAYALRRGGRILESRGELWSYEDGVARDLGDWVRAAFQRASVEGGGCIRIGAPRAGL